MKVLILVFLSYFCVSAFANDYHTFKKSESLWFLAQVYYGNGAEFTKILKANKLKSPDDVADGQKLSIPNPKFSNKDPDFWARYEKVNEKRLIALGGKAPSVGSPAKIEKVMFKEDAQSSMPDGFRIKIKRKVRESSLSPSDRARTELQEQ